MQARSLGAKLGDCVQMWHSSRDAATCLHIRLFPQINGRKDAQSLNPWECRIHGSHPAAPAATTGSNPAGRFVAKAAIPLSAPPSGLDLSTVKNYCGAVLAKLNVSPPAPAIPTSGNDVTQLGMIGLLGGQPTKLAPAAVTEGNVTDPQMLDILGGHSSKLAAISAGDSHAKSNEDISTACALEAAAKGSGLDLASLQDSLALLIGCLAGTVAHPHMLALAEKCQDPSFFALSDTETAASLKLKALLDADAKHAILCSPARAGELSSAIHTDNQGANARSLLCIYQTFIWSRFNCTCERNRGAFLLHTHSITFGLQGM